MKTSDTQQQRRTRAPQPAICVLQLGRWAGRLHLLGGLLLLLAAGRVPAQFGPPPPDALTHLRRILPSSPSWEAWLEQHTDQLPNFTTLPRIPYLPDPLRFANGREVKQGDWPRRRRELLGQFQYYLTGSLPPPPTNLRPARIQSRQEAGAFIDDVTLEFGPQHAARLRLELIIPKGPPPFPVLITPREHRSWALVGVSRGYVGCVYGGDHPEARDDTAAWTNIWPQADWSQLTRRAWAASRCVDYVRKLPVVRTNQIALAGHGPLGKAALIAAAFDPRFNAVIVSSSGAGGVGSWRFDSETQFGEGLERSTRLHPEWFHPRLRCFVGRENQLPIDQSELLACLAPRPCLVVSAFNDPSESIWAVEQSFASARRVYELLGRGKQLYLRYRPGGPAVRTADVEGCLDWLEAVFGRAPFLFADVTTFPTYALWEKVGEEKIDPLTFPTNDLRHLLAGTNRITRITTPSQWLEKRREVRDRVLWGLGQAPPFAEAGASVEGAEPAHLARLLGRAAVPAGLEKRRVNFGNHIAGDLYAPTNSGRSLRQLPAVVWLHPMSVARGYAPPYVRGEAPYLALARRGFAVLAFDQIGNGARLEEVRNFYFRYPYWSLLGKMVEDTLAGVEALRKIPFIDGRRIYLLGYALGGRVALHAGALDDRIAGIVAVAGFTPMRLDTLTKGTGGVARWSRWLPLQPRLGAFITHETRIPYDFHEVLALIAPRPARLFAPRIDSQATLDDVQTCVAEAAKVFQLLNAKTQLSLRVLEDYNHLSPETQKAVTAALTTLAGL